MRWGSLDCSRVLERPIVTFLCPCLVLSTGVHSSSESISIVTF